MSGCLLDTNLLIALAWPQHIHHLAAHRWFGNRGRGPWATCPLTELGFIRVSSNPRIIPEAVAPADALALLRRMVVLPGHQFWPDSISATNAEIFDRLALIGHRQVTDAYLIALAQQQQGKLATFDRGIPELLKEQADRKRYVELVSAEG